MSRQHRIAAAARVSWAACLLATQTMPAMATPAPAPASYTGYVLGVHAFDLTFDISLRPADYRVAASFRLAGVLGALWPAEGSTVVDGRFSGGKPVPREMVSQGRYWGTAHVLRVEWKDGLPTIVQLSPPAERDREPVPVRDQVNTTDTLTAVAALIQEVATSGRCDLSVHTFDGSRLSELSGRTVGQEVLKPTERSSFHGQALRCELTGRMIGGFCAARIMWRPGAPKRRPSGSRGYTRRRRQSRCAWFLPSKDRPAR